MRSMCGCSLTCHQNTLLVPRYRRVRLSLDGRCLFVAPFSSEVSAPTFVDKTRCKVRGSPAPCSSKHAAPWSLRPPKCRTSSSRTLVYGRLNAPKPPQTPSAHLRAGKAEGARALKHLLIGVFQRDDSPEEVDMLGLFGHEEDLHNPLLHSDWYLAMGRVAKW